MNPSTNLTSFNKALTDYSIFMVFQPIASINTEETVGFEALCRFRDSSGRILQPSKFLPKAEEFGWITELDLFVISQVITTLENWKSFLEKKYFITINVSATSVSKTSFIKSLKEVFKNHEYLCDRIIIEITETNKLKSTDKIKKQMQQMRLMGLRLAVDDFGLGYSTLQYLQDLNWDFLKVDKNFTNQILSSKSTYSIFRAIFMLAKDLNLKVVVEGVETDSQLAKLPELGVDLIQGFLVGKPTIKPKEKKFLS
jgi:EAL domain-containing protein (putative c-di-GMP-specific phosphodiesterase class I)